MLEGFNVFPKAQRDGITVAVVGLGGTGGRVMAGLVKILPPESTINLWDGDHVEARNLIRQNFLPDDVGRNKAEVMAERYSIDGGPLVVAHPQHLTNESHLLSNRLILGCTDSLKWRRWAVSHLNTNNGPYYSCLLVDSGTERKTGQILLEGSWPGFIGKGMNPTEAALKPPPAEHQNWMSGEIGLGRAWLRFHGISVEQPDLIAPSTVASNFACAEVLDLQTVAVNNLAAAFMLCYVSSLLDGIPMATVGTRFSTVGAAHPVLIKPTARVTTGATGRSLATFFPSGEPTRQPTPLTWDAA